MIVKTVCASKATVKVEYWQKLANRLGLEIDILLKSSNKVALFKVFTIYSVDTYLIIIVEGSAISKDIFEEYC